MNSPHKLTSQELGCAQGIQQSDHASALLWLAKMEEDPPAARAQRRLQNIFAPIFHLPPELLRTLFLHLILNVDLTTPYPSTGSWKAVLSVCKHWRDVGMQDPRLWAYWGTFEYPRCLELHASLSRNAPLIIRADAVSMSVKLSAAWRAALRNPTTRERVCVLDANLQFDSTFLDPFSVPVNHGRTSRIQHLRLDATGYPWRYNLPTTFSTDEFPHLSYLHLNKCTVDWAAPMLDTSALTHLVITRTAVSNRPTISRIAKILSEQPKLTTLKLELQIGPESIMHTTKPISLRHLQEIQLQGSCKSCIGLMASISHPKEKTKVSLDLKGSENVDLERLLIPFFSGYYNSQNRPSIRCLALTVANGYLQFLFWHEGVEILDSIFAPSSGPTVTTIIPAPGRSIDHAMKDLITSFPLSDLRQLSVTGLDFTVSEWRFSIFPPMKNLQSLKICGTTMASAISALDPRLKLEGLEAGIQQPAPLSRLNRILIKGADLQSTSSMPASRNVLARCVRSLYRAGRELAYLEVEKCENAPYHLWDSLRPFVVVLEWDFKGVLYPEPGQDPELYQEPDPEGSNSEEDSGDEDGYSEEETSEEE